MPLYVVTYRNMLPRKGALAYNEMKCTLEFDSLSYRLRLVLQAV